MSLNGFPFGVADRVLKRRRCDGGVNGDGTIGLLSSTSLPLDSCVDSGSAMTTGIEGEVEEFKEPSKLGKSVPWKGLIDGTEIAGNPGPNKDVQLLGVPIRDEGDMGLMEKRDRDGVLRGEVGFTWVSFVSSTALLFPLLFKE